jgi:branched-subunit amino acid ABC-type transport system permease component
MSFFFEVLIGGMLSGLLYSLVAIGFVLIYRASGVFNFAQGATVLFAALTFVSLLERGVPFWLSFILTLLILTLLALATERIVLRPPHQPSARHFVYGNAGFERIYRRISTTVVGHAGSRIGFGYQR